LIRVRHRVCGSADQLTFQEFCVQVRSGGPDERQSQGCLSVSLWISKTSALCMLRVYGADFTSQTASRMRRICRRVCQKRLCSLREQQRGRRHSARWRDEQHARFMHPIPLTDLIPNWISWGCRSLDLALGGGIRTGMITELAGVQVGRSLSRATAAASPDVDCPRRTSRSKITALHAAPPDSATATRHGRSGSKRAVRNAACA
jgi:hypothetical protein